MTAWAHSLIRIANYEVETLQKRLAEISARKAEAQMRLAVLDAEAEVERQNARHDPRAGMMLRAYLAGWTQRRADAQAEAAAVAVEEEGARDALTAAFEELKKFEHVAETTRLNRRADAARREAAAYDEMGLRRRG